MFPQTSAAGYGHNLALKPDGTVRAWGNNHEGQLNIRVGLNGMVAVAAGRDDSLALKSDGTVKGWGFNDYGQTTVPAGLDLRLRFKVSSTGKGISPGVLLLPLN